MAKINNKSKYPFDINISLDDFIIGSDANNSDITRNYKLSGLYSTFKSALNLSSLEYTFSDGVVEPTLDETDAGYFTSNAETAAAIVEINLNKIDLNGIDISSLLNIVNEQPTSFILRLFKASVTGQIFYFAITDIVDNLDDTYTLSVENFVGGNVLEDDTTYGIVFDLAGVPSIYTETDPIFIASPAGSILGNDITNWNTAYLWGDHSLQGYLKTIAINDVTGFTDNSTNWDTAYLWGNHALEGYLTSFTETDPVFTASDAFSITNSLMATWDAAYSWGDHSIEGYLKNETDPVFTSSDAFNITNLMIASWNAAYSWGDHDAVGYLLTNEISTLDGLNLILEDATLISDAPSDGSNYVRNNATWVLSPPVEWGSITGTLSDQTDLQSVLNTKSPTNHTHLTADITNLDVYTGFDSRYYTETEMDTFLDNKVSKSGDTMTGQLTVPDIFTISSDLSTDIRAIDLRTAENEDQSIRIRHEVLDGNLLESGYAIIIESQNTTPNNNAHLEVEGNIYAQGSKVWHAGNHGAGSGLDADTLRTFVPSTSNTPNTVMLRDGDGSILAENITAENAMIARSTNAFRAVGSGTGVSNVSFNSFYESNASTRQGYIGFPTTNNSHLYIRNDVGGNNIIIRDNGEFTFEGGAVTAANFILSSDRTLKENILNHNIEPIEMELKWFNWKQDKGQGRPQLGVIAQELEVNHPEFVITNDEGVKSVAYIDLLLAKVSELESRIKQLEK